MYLHSGIDAPPTSFPFFAVLKGVSVIHSAVENNLQSVECLEIYIASPLFGLPISLSMLSTVMIQCRVLKEVCTQL